MRAMETVQHLIEEAKLRTAWWGVCVFAISYFLTHTSKSMWTNIPMSIIILAFLRYLSFKVELRWRVPPVRKQTYLSQLAKRQLSTNDYRLSTVPPVSRWRRKVDSPLVEAALESFIDKILRDFVVDLWYSSITPDREAPELIHSLILDAFGEISGRVKEMNLVDLLTRDMVDLIGNHLEIYRRIQSQIGVDVMETLSSEERDERLKRHLIASKELHPALLSSEHEYKVLQQIVGGVIAVVLRPQEAQSPLVRCFCRELLTCLVTQPVMNLASPTYINELIVYIFLTNKDKSSGATNLDKSNNAASQAHDQTISKGDIKDVQMELRASSVQSNDQILTKSSLATHEGDNSKVSKDVHDAGAQHRQPDWAVVLEAANKRRSLVLAPENLENMWTRGTHYQKKLMKAERSSRMKSSRGAGNVANSGSVGKELSPNFNERITSIDDKYMVNLMDGSNRNTQDSAMTNSVLHPLREVVESKPKEGSHFDDDSQENFSEPINNMKGQLKRSCSTPDIDTTVLRNSGQPIASQQNLNSRRNKEEQSSAAASQSDGLLYVPKIRCRVVGAYFEKLGSKSFAVYSIAVTDADNKSWFVKRRYRNFERLHRHLKEIPNYSLHLPPKSFLSSSIDDYLVHQRCILLDKYLQDLLSIANIAEQHEVWDFLSASSKNYSSGKSTSVMKTLAVNVDDAMDDIVRQFKGVSDGLKRKVVGTSPSTASSSRLAENRMALSWNKEETNEHNLHFRNLETTHSLSDDDSSYEDRPSSVNHGWHSDNEMNARGYHSCLVKHIEESSSLDSRRSQQLEKPIRANSDTAKSLDQETPIRANSDTARSLSSIDPLEDPTGIPPEWTPANVSVPLLNLVDKICQLKRRGWIRRQVLWISKQILQLMMEDAIDDWILRQIHWLRRDDVIAQGICWVQDILWPNGTFFTRLDSFQGKTVESQFDKQPSESTNQMVGDRSIGSSSFELQLEATRNASDVKKLLLGGTPSTLVSIIGFNQYHRSARDIYYFLQSTVCVKQLTYAMLEAVIVSVFPELRQLISDIHKKARKE